MVIVEGVRVEALVDTGACVSIIRRDLCSRLWKVTAPYDGPTLLSAQGDTITPSAMCTTRVYIDGILHHIQFAVLRSCAQKLILGWDFLSAASAYICCQECVLHMDETTNSLYPQDSENDAPLRLLAEADIEIPAGLQRIVAITSDVIDTGDVLAIPSARWLARGIVFTTGLVRFANGSSKKVLIPKGATLACTSGSHSPSFPSRQLHLQLLLLQLPPLPLLFPLPLAQT